MRADELKRGVDSIASAASEGKLLAQDVSRDRTRSTFVRVHARDLADDVNHEAEKLADAQAHGEVARIKAQAVALAQQVSDALGDLQVMPADATTGAHVATRLRHYAAKAGELSAAL